MNFVLNFVFQLYLVIFGNPFKYYYQMLISIILCIITLACLPVVAAYVEGFPGFLLSCILITLQGFANAVFQCNMFGIAGYLPIKFVIGVSYGNGIAGLGTNVLKYITLAIFGSSNDIDTLRKGTFVFYGISVLVLVIGLILYMTMFKDPWFINELTNGGAVEFTKEEVEEIRSKYEFEETKPFIEEKDRKKDDRSTFEVFKVLMKQLFYPNVFIFFNYFITFSLFPGLLFTLDIL